MVTDFLLARYMGAAMAPAMTIVTAAPMIAHAPPLRPLPSEVGAGGGEGTGGGNTAMGTRNRCSIVYARSG